MANTDAVSHKDEWETFSLKRHRHLLPTTRLYNFQDFSVFKSLQSPVFVFGLATGLGKTLVSYLTALWYADRVPVRTLIVTKSTAVVQYENEFGKFFDPKSHAVKSVHNAMSKGKYSKARMEAYDQWSMRDDSRNKVDILIINWSIFQRDHLSIRDACDRIRQNGRLLVVVYDEVTAIQNLSTATHKAARNISKAALTPLEVDGRRIVGKVIGATATMTKGKLETMYGIFKGMGLQITRSLNEFYAKYVIYRQDKFRKMVIGYKNTQDFVKKVSPYVVVIKKRDVAKYLPAFQPPRIVNLTQSREQIRVINDIYDGFIDTEDNQKNFIEHLTKTGYIKRALLDHRLVTPDSKEISHSPLTAELLYSLSEEYYDEKVIVYSQSLKYLNILKDAIRKSGNKISPNYRKPLEISGDVPDMNARERNKNLFSDHGSGRNLMLMTNAGTEAINLQAADTLLITTIPNSGGDLIQLAGRISRLGSSGGAKSMVYYIHDNSMNEDEYDIVHQQAYLISLVQGEFETNLVDHDAVKRASRLTHDISEEDLMARSAAYMILHHRKRRAAWYAEQLQGRPGSFSALG